MDYWEGPARWINTILLIIVAFIGFDTLFRLLNANEENVIVGTVAAVAGVFLAPFEGMFPDQEFLLTAIIAVLGYSLLAGIALAVTRSVAASRRSRARRRAEENPEAAPGEAPTGQPGVGGRDSDTTRPLGPPPGDGEGTADGGKNRSASRADATDPHAAGPDAAGPDAAGPDAAGPDATQPTSRNERRSDRSDRTQTDRTERLS